MIIPSLPKSYRKMFPFRLATTSYIYPDRIVPNVARLAPFLDEIELVLFESKGEDNFPDESEKKALMDLSLQEGITYDVHLPIDIFLGNSNEEARLKGASTIIEVIELTSKLSPSVYTLHFDPGNEPIERGAELTHWWRLITRSVREILSCGVPSKRISVENLNYPFEWVENIIREFQLSICLDIGHILIGGQNLEAYFERYLADTSIIHLHGFENGTDHLGIDRLPESTLKRIFSGLSDFYGILSLEVFSLDDLHRSLALLEEKWPGS